MRLQCWLYEGGGGVGPSPFGTGITLFSQNSAVPNDCDEDTENLSHLTSGTFNPNLLYVPISNNIHMEQSFKDFPSFLIISHHLFFQTKTVDFSGLSERHWVSFRLLHRVPMTPLWKNPHRYQQNKLKVTTNFHVVV